MDFEKAAWGAVASILPDVHVQGCAFHWGQAVWRKVQNIGLRSKYLQDAQTFKYIRRLMALPLLPAEHIQPVFSKLEKKAETDALKELVGYLSTTWIESTIWPPSHWSVFGQSVRTNNDVEGWHQRLDSKGRAKMNFYILLDLLHQEAEMVVLTMKLVSERKLVRHQRKNYRDLQAKLASEWDKYRSGELNAMGLLKACAGMYGPVTD